MVPWKSTAEEISFEWSHHRISSIDSKVITKLPVSIIDSGSERDHKAYQLVSRPPLTAFQSVLSLSSAPVFAANLPNDPAFPDEHCNTHVLSQREHGKECERSCDPKKKTIINKSCLSAFVICRHLY